MLARHVALPLARPALAVGLSLALLEDAQRHRRQRISRRATLTLSIFTTWLNRGSLPGAAQIACVMLVIVIALIALERYGRAASPLSSSSPRRQRVVPRIAADGRRARGSPSLPARCRCVLGFLLPVGLSRLTR